MRIEVNVACVYILFWNVVNLRFEDVLFIHKTIVYYCKVKNNQPNILKYLVGIYLRPRDLELDQTMNLPTEHIPKARAP